MQIYLVTCKMRRSLASLARAYNLQFFFLSVHLGVLPPQYQKLATLVMDIEI